MNNFRLTAGRALMSTALFGSLILGFKAWIWDYVRLAIRGDLVDRVVGRYLIPGFVCMAVWLVGNYLIVVVGQELKQESRQNEQQTDVQEKLTDDNLTARVTAQNNLVGRNVTGKNERIYPDDDSPHEVKNKAELLHVLNFLPNVELCHGVESRSDVTELTPATGSRWINV